MLPSLASRIVAAALLFTPLGGTLRGEDTMPTLPQQPDDPRVEHLLKALTLEEKLDLLGGTGFETKPVPRLGIPALAMTDGPVGVRWEKSSAFPVSIMMAAGWNPERIRALGAALGREAKAHGRRMLLGPCVNIHRVPHAGRNFESFGEDPYLAARLAVAYVEGVQSEKVVATTKHFACNNQEHERDFTNVTVDERALREIYLPAFEAAVTEGGSLSVMSAYNKVNGAWCSENPRLLTDILKEEWGFRGFVVSDWGAVHSTIPTANAGLDIEMPKGVFLNKETLLPAISAGTVQGRTIDDKIRRLLRVIVWTGILDGAAKDTGALDRPDHRQIALQTAREGVVLLKNAGGTLPLDPARIRSIAVIGPNAATARTGGGGSSQVNPLYAVSTLDAVRKRTGTAIAVRYAAGCRSEGEMDPIPSSALQPPSSPAGMHGLKAEYFANANLEGAPVLTRVDPQVDFDWSDGSPGAAVPVDNFSGRWSGTLVAPITGNYTLSVSSDDGVRLFLDGKAVIEHWSDHATETRSVTLPLTAGQVVGVVLEYYEHAGGANLRFGWRTGDEKLHDEAIAAARGADVVLLCIGTGPQLESEGFDRKSLTLPDDQIALVKGVVEANPRTIVVLNSGAPLLMDGWLDRVPALLEAWFPGEEGGTAVAEVLFGDSNPSGKLPMTFPARWEDAPAYGNFPGKGSVDYAEGIFIGYRHFDRKNLDVLFPFGHGLSYTSFAYGPLAVTTPGKAEGASATVAVEVTNTGARAGDEVVQLYVHDREASVERPTRELKGFRRVALAPGETKRVTFSLDARAFAYYSVREKRWEVEPGTFEILVGSSSRDIRSREVLTLQ